MFTKRGWSLLGAAIGLVVGGRLLGLEELYVIGAAVGTLLGGSALWNATRRLDLRAQRRLPERLVVGGDGRIDVAVETGASAPTLALTDAFDGGRRSARFLLPSMQADERARAAYRVPTERRGRHRLGPLTATLGDPFGLTERAMVVAGEEDVVIFPRVHEVVPPPEGVGDDRDTESRRLPGRPESNGEFHALREYATGDDLRRVNWKATARHGRLMIRHDEVHRRAPMTLLLDTRPGAHDRASFEAAIEAAASVSAALDRAGRPVEVVTTSGTRLGTPGRRHLASVMDELAILEPGGSDRIAPALLERRAGALCAVMGNVGSDDARVLSLLARTDAIVTLISTGARPPAALPGPHRRPPVVVHTPAGRSFPSAWNHAVSRWHRNRPRRPSPSPR